MPMSQKRHHAQTRDPRLTGRHRGEGAVAVLLAGEPGQGTETWLHVRLADTRSGEIVGAGMVPLDSVGPTARVRADAAIRALLANPLPTPP